MERSKIRELLQVYYDSKRKPALKGRHISNSSFKSNVSLDMMEESSGENDDFPMMADSLIHTPTAKNVHDQNQCFENKSTMIPAQQQAPTPKNRKANLIRFKHCLFKDSKKNVVVETLDELKVTRFNIEECQKPKKLFLVEDNAKKNWEDKQTQEPEIKHEKLCMKKRSIRIRKRAQNRTIEKDHKIKRISPKKRSPCKIRRRNSISPWDTVDEQDYYQL